MDQVTRANIRRLGVTAVALAATVGAVGLMRVAARALAGGFSAEATRRADAVQPSRLPAPKTYDLVALVPEDLRLNLGGMVAQSTKATMPMPLDQAIQTSANEARAQGWKALDLPLAYELATLRDFGGLYLTPDRRIVRRAHTPLAGGGTQREDFSLPAGARLSLDRPMTFEEAVGLANELMLARFPDVLRAVQVAQPVYTQFNAHDTGAAFLVVGLSSWEEADVRKQLAATYARAGWKRRADLPGAWVKANLSATWDVAPRAAGVGSVVTVRYADDEILVNRKENEDGE